MESKKFPVELNGKQYLVERTFGNEPAIYSATAFQRRSRTTGLPFLTPIPEDCVIIVARPADLEELHRIQNLS